MGNTADAAFWVSVHILVGNPQKITTKIRIILMMFPISKNVIEIWTIRDCLNKASIKHHD